MYTYSLCSIISIVLHYMSQSVKSGEVVTLRITKVRGDLLAYVVTYIGTVMS